jgi:serine/threonine protein kinase
MTNGSLDKKIKSLNLKEKYKILIDICDGMEYLHSRSPPIIHRDLKTANILLNDLNEAKISDFGISKVLSNLNTTQTQKGTPIYQSPGKFFYNKNIEQFPQNGDRIVSTPADIYCFGSIIYGKYNIF